MKSQQWFLALERFFLDIIGTVLPGLVFLVPFLLYVQVFTGGKAVPLFSFEQISSQWVLVIAGSYIIGHVLASVGHRILARYVHVLSRGVWGIKSQETIASEIIQSKNGSLFEEWVSGKISNYSREDDSRNALSQLRNIAMSFLTQEQYQLIHRFMFLSLLNLSVAVALLVLCLMSVLSPLLVKWLGFAIWDGPSLFWFLVLVPFLIERRFTFYKTSMATPFSMALGYLTVQRSKKSGPEGDCPTNVSSGKPKVYLAGGMRSGWQDQVMSRLAGADYYDPREHKYKDVRHYTEWDLEAIKRSDWMFAYFEAENPSGFGLALEIGFAKALNKTVILVDEKSASDDEVRNYFAMCREAADVCFDDLGKALDYAISLRLAESISVSK